MKDGEDNLRIGYRTEYINRICETEKLVIAQLHKKFSTVYGIWSFIMIFKRHRKWMESRAR